MLVLACLSIIALSVQAAEIEQNNKNLELSLRVIEAFEHGPVILDVTLTNRGMKPLRVRKYSGMPHSSIVPPAEWNAWAPVRSGCAGTLDDQVLEHGMRLTERQLLHQELISGFPAGDYRVTVNWALMGQPLPGQGPWRILARLKKTVPVTISPATPSNRYALAARFEAEFKSLPPGACGRIEDPLWHLRDKLLGARHKELMPLAMKMLDRSQLGPEEDLASSFRREMAAVVLQADPAAGHRIFVDRLLADPPRMDASSVFEIWHLAAGHLGEIGQSVIHRTTNLPYWTNPAWFQELWPEDELVSLFLWANYSVPCILPDHELKRLSSAKDFTVRAWVYYTFGPRLGRTWCAAFLQEAQRAVEAKPDVKKREKVSPALVNLVTTLVYSRQDAHNKRLLDIFLAGAQDNPIAMVARDELAKRENYEKKYKR
jgi:hypothetical protein